MMGGVQNGERGSEGQAERCRGVWTAVRGFVGDPGAGRVVGMRSRGVLVVLGACSVVSELCSMVPRGIERWVESSMTWQFAWMHKASSLAHGAKRGQAGGD
jgi:hypothetical protein